VNFFIGDHPTAGVRIRNLERELAYNYAGASGSR